MGSTDVADPSSRETGSLSLSPHCSVSVAGGGGGCVRCGTTSLQRAWWLSGLRASRAESRKRISSCYLFHSKAANEWWAVGIYMSWTSFYSPGKQWGFCALRRPYCTIPTICSSRLRHGYQWMLLHRLREFLEIGPSVVGVWFC